MSVAHLDPSTPVLVGVGQSSERIDQPGYRGMSAVELAAAAAGQALADTGLDPRAVAPAVDTVAGVRQFEISTPGARAPLGRSDNYPRSVARRLGAAPRRAVLEVGGGQSPQHLVNEFAATIAAGHAEVVLLFGSEAISTTRHLSAAQDRPDFTEHVDGDLEDRGYGLDGLISRYATEHGLTGAPETYALFDNARRARLGLSRADHARSMGELFAPFTRVAAENPHAAAPVERDAVELVTPTERNRPIADPYPRYLVARDQVNQGAAVLLMSIAAARRLGVPEQKWVFLHGHADLRERDLLERADLGSGPASVLAARHALQVAGLAVDDITTFDFYSCFPVAVSTTAVDGLGLAADDPRGLTLTGGLPFFGGAGNNYSMHAVAETVHRARTAPGTFGFVGANGGMLSKYSVGIYSTTPVAWRPDDSAALQAQIDAWEAPAQTLRANGWAMVETYTVKHDRAGNRTGIVVGRLEADGRRFLAMTTEGDEAILDVLSVGEPIGHRVHVRSTSRGNRVTTTDSRMAELHPVRVPGFRDHYDDVLIRRDGHVLEVTIDRPEQRNALTPPANDELDDVFDAFFADPDLWVAVLTGAGDKAFSAGNDLLWTGSGKPMWVPENGFAGLTSRPSLPKPVIAAVNGFAMGGGCEIALTCHLVVADETAVFALSEVRVGLIAGAGGLVRLPRTVPAKLANEMILTGRRLTADEALAHGLVNRVVPAGTALEGARALARDIIAASPTSVRISLQVMEGTQGIADTIEAVTHPTAAIDDLLLSEDMVEGLTAFAQKRAPQWKNR
ncbi:acetyl-CoA acetyltransferase [Modestobacter sp. I12A-02628]|uniref:enoyl-CoA hydratase n=1 Tax=Goekera deserti TaxID=2497753 RepID=A0A7K3WDB5_9ACTN|nr:acetyl-CoA acetyltransferase [Goekera deserti]MPQ96938.1 acetyl-CoA acetyltransferase [Goekera deserti]NDI46747.1 acetyl-CoA acetyltransferase [Goekera deserti]NEL54316.1 acetyl-CoA acetyltransferase [Goekera deserti]